MAEGVDGGTYARDSSRPLHQHAPVFSSDTADVSSGNADEYRTVLWGYPVRTRSDACVAFIDAFFHQVCIPLPLLDMYAFHEENTTPALRHLFMWNWNWKGQFPCYPLFHSKQGMAEHEHFRSLL